MSSFKGFAGMSIRSAGKFKPYSILFKTGKKDYLADSTKGTVMKKFDRMTRPHLPQTTPDPAKKFSPLI
jgi:hypothetical protein